jgi:4'-phosphopantetheinyl transferase
VDADADVDADVDEVEVWVVAGPGPAEAELFAVLDAEERERAAAYRSAVDRRRFVLAHGALRHIVAARLGAPAGELRFRRGPHGKPELAGRWQGAQLNLSHSAEVAMVALSAARPVGVDVQQVLPRLDAAAMARRYFPPQEAGHVGAAPDALTRAERFARLWARKEALTKAHGGRLAQALRVPVPDGPPPPDLPARDAWSRGYRLTDVPAPPGYRAAVALAGDAAFTVAQHHWTGPPSPAPALDPEPQP